MSLRDALNETLDEGRSWGNSLSDGARRMLRARRERSFRLFWSGYVLILSMTLLAGAAIIVRTRDPTIVAAASIGTAISMLVGLELLRRTWREWSQTSLLLIVLEDASEAETKVVIEKLVRKL